MADDAAGPDLRGLTASRTKIVATVGPASSAPDVLRRLIEAGVDVFRLNFSHGTHEEHGAVVSQIRAASRELGREIAVLQDLCGPKIRLGPIPGDVVDCRAGRRVHAWSPTAPPTPARADLLLLASCRTTSRSAKRCCSPTAPSPWS